MSLATTNTFNNGSNPWFLENTKDVAYCLEVDEAAMGITRMRAAELVRKAFDYWKLSFADASSEEYSNGELAPFGQVRVATQHFIEKSCDQAVDLRFQLGMLQPVQAELLVDPLHYVGIAMRTSYDPKLLRGQGFIYVSPQSGLLRPTSTVFGDEPWSRCDGCLLEGVLKHEIGHIFGLGHTDTDAFDLMTNQFPAELTSVWVVGEGAESSEGKKVLEYQMNRSYFVLDRQPYFVTEVDHEESFAREVFGLLQNEDRIRLVEKAHPNGRRLVFEAAAGSSSAWTEIGEYCWEKTQDASYKRAVEVYVDEQQEVFSKLPHRKFYGVLIAAHRRFGFGSISGSLCSSRGAIQRPILLNMTDHSNRYLGTVEGSKILLEWLRDSTRLRVGL